MVASGTQGRIIFTSSWVAEIPWPEITAYTVSKAGLNMLMKQMARELAVYGIRVNAVAPWHCPGGPGRAAAQRGTAVCGACREGHSAGPTRHAG